MPAKKTAVAKAEALTNPALVKIRKDLLRPNGVLVSRAMEITVLNAEGAIYADQILGEITTQRRIVEEKVNTILDPLNAARGAAHALRKDLDDPLKAADASVRRALADFRKSEAELIEASKQQTNEAAQQLLNRAAEAEQKAQVARTRPIQEKYASQALEFNRQALLATVTPITEPVKLDHSTTRMVPRWEIFDMNQFWAGVVGGHIPANVLVVDESKLNEYLRVSRAEMSLWPGIRVWDEPTIVRRGA